MNKNINTLAYYKYLSSTYDPLKYPYNKLIRSTAFYEYENEYNMSPGEKI